MTSSKRIVGLDWLRVLATLGVVAIHSLDTNPAIFRARYAAFAVPSFLLISFYLMAAELTHWTGPLRAYAASRCRRLLPSFLLWTAIYMSARLIASGQHDISVSSVLSDIFLGSSAVQMYFIPFLLYCLFLIAPLFKLNRPFRIILLAIGALVTLVASYYHAAQAVPGAEPGTFLIYALTFFPYAAGGVLVYECAFLQRIPNSPFLRTFYFSGLFFLGMLLYTGRNVSVLFEMTAALMLFLAFLVLPIKASRAVEHLSFLSFGVFFSHHLIVEMMQLVEKMLGINNSGAGITLGNFAWGILVSFLVTDFFSRHRHLRLLAGISDVKCASQENKCPKS